LVVIAIACEKAMPATHVRSMSAKANFRVFLLPSNVFIGVVSQVKKW